MRVSIVICTHNRASSLLTTLRALRRQRHTNFEVIVVNGPSTDDTEQVLTEFEGQIKLARCAAANLSMSRNIGVRSASGEVVAFLDDDAVPEDHWLSEALPCFSDTDVGGVGGIVFDHTGMALQYHFSAADRFGNVSTSDDHAFDDFAFPGSFKFPYLQGTNALFRRSVLEEVGGFDEVYDYYLDETDLCCRVVDAGYRLIQLDGAPVHHKFLPSGVRDHQRVVTNWFPIVKNHVYFGYRHGVDVSSELQVIDATRRFIDSCVEDAELHESAGRLPPGASAQAAELMGRALATGIAVGRERRDVRLPRLVAAPISEFLRFPVESRDDGLSVVIISSDYPPRMTGGIARFIGDLAPAVAHLGNDVRVITRAAPEDSIGTVDLEGDVWVHRIACPILGNDGLAPQTLPHINVFVTASAAELARISYYTRIDAVYAPAWDVDALGALRTSPLPVVLKLSTPVAMTVQAPDHRSAVASLLELEHEVFSRAERVHANSGAVVETIQREYGDVFSDNRVTVIPLGLDDRVKSPSRPPDRDGALRVLFAGRLEHRKGIDVLLATIERLAPTFRTVEWTVAGADPARVDGSVSTTEKWRANHRIDPWLDRVHFPGSVDDDELHSLVEQADLIVLPSRFESFGLIMAEAMMHGRALVSCSVGGICEVVRDGLDGVLVPPGDVDALTSAVEELLADGDRRLRLGRSGRERFEAALTIDRSAERISELIGQAAARRPGSEGVHVERADVGRTFTRLVPRSLLALDPEGEEWQLKLVSPGGASLAVSACQQSIVELQPNVPHWAIIDPHVRTTVEVVFGSVLIVGPTTMVPPDESGTAD